MKGWKTWAGGGALILSGIATVIQGAISDPVDLEKIKAGLMMIGSGLGIIGIGHKIEKASNGVKE